MQAPRREDPRFLREQIITYIGNKRHLLGLIGRGLQAVRRDLGGRRLRCFDAFSGSGVVSRYLKRFACELYSNDLEDYACRLNSCYLANRSELPEGLEDCRREIAARAAQEPQPGLISELYAPQDDAAVQAGERVFYSRRNALFLDTARRLIAQAPAAMQPFLLAPLLYEASVHTNTGGVFKGFYKNRQGIGQFGGEGRHALLRILGEISLPAPLFSRFELPCHVLNTDATAAARQLPELDLAYLDPPYNQHPYGSNYFMLNLLARYERPSAFSAVSGIPTDWKRSAYNKRQAAAAALEELILATAASHILISYNAEGYIPPEEMRALLRRHGRLSVMQTRYNTFRACRKLYARSKHVTEYLYLLRR